MTTRAGMTELIAELRLLTDAGTADYSDEQLQSRLDKNRCDFRRDMLKPEPTYNGGTIYYYDYYFQRKNVEGTASGTAAWRVEDSLGNTIAGTLYTPNLDARHILFAANTAGSAYYLTGREYNLYIAAAEVWDQKAADVAGSFDLKIDNHDLKRSQLVAQYKQMAAQFRAKAKPTFTRLKRVDVN